MMKHNDLPQLISSYFIRCIPERSGYSENTVKSYRDAFVLLFRYQKEVLMKSVTKLSLEQMDRRYVEGFLNWLEEGNSYSIASVNQRLAALHSFFRYVITEAPEYIETCASILAIRMKKVSLKPMSYLSVDAVKKLLSLPDMKSKNGRRDLAVLILLYDSGARVQEISDLIFGDIRNRKPATVKLTGKGSKTRIVPLMPQTLDIMLAYMKDCSLDGNDFTCPLFFNKQGRKLSRAGVSYILDKYVSKARSICPELFPKAVTPHTLRHSKAMHLLEGGVNLVYIRDFLGHESVVTTEIYAKSNPEIKRKAVEDASPKVLPEERYTIKEKQDMLNWLRNLI